MNDFAPLAAGISATTYRTSSYSSGTGNCVAVGRAADLVGVQDTKEGADSAVRTTLAFSRGEFAAFLAMVAQR